MPVDPVLENYLSILDSMLRPLPVSERADIVIEIKSHILDATSRGEPPPSLQTVLEALGSPEQVANRYLIERKLTMAKPPISPIVKWLLAGCFSTVALVLLMVMAIVWKALEENALGDFKADWNQKYIGWKLEAPNQSAEYELLDGDKALSVVFDDGILEFSTSDNRALKTKCLLPKRQTGPLLSPATDGMRTLDLQGLAGAKCELSVPRGVEVKVQGANGIMRFEKPEFAVEARLSNGLVKIEPKAGIRYGFHLKTANGSIESGFESQENPEFVVNVEVANGRIDHE